MVNVQVLVWLLTGSTLLQGALSYLKQRRAGENIMASRTKEICYIVARLPPAYQDT